MAPIASKWSTQIGGNLCCGPGRCCSDGLLTAKVPDHCQAGTRHTGNRVRNGSLDHSGCLKCSSSEDIDLLHQIQPTGNVPFLSLSYVDMIRHGISIFEPSAPTGAPKVEQMLTEKAEPMRDVPTVPEADC